MKKYLEAGRLCAPRGVKGELRFDCWCDSPEFLRGVERLYLDEAGGDFLRVKKYFPSIPSIVFEGYEDRRSASVLTGRTLWFNRAEVVLEDGAVFNDDLIGLPVYDAESGLEIGTLSAVEEGTRHWLYRVSGGERAYLLPAVPEFIVALDPEKGLRVRLIEGL